MCVFVIFVTILDCFHTALLCPAYSCDTARYTWYTIVWLCSVDSICVKSYFTPCNLLWQWHLCWLCRDHIWRQSVVRYNAGRFVELFVSRPEWWRGSSSGGLVVCEPVDGSGSGVRGSEWGRVCGDEGGTEELSMYPVQSRARSTRPCLTQDPTAACRGKDTAHEMAKPGNWHTDLCYFLICSLLYEEMPARYDV